MGKWRGVVELLGRRLWMPAWWLWTVELVKYVF